MLAYSAGNEATRSGNGCRNGHGYLIRCADEVERAFWQAEWRPASPDEAAGIEAVLASVAEDLSRFCSLDQLEAMIEDAEMLADDMDWDAYADSVCTCRPDRGLGCPACLDASEAR